MTIKTTLTYQLQINDNNMMLSREAVTILETTFKNFDKGNDESSQKEIVHTSDLPVFSIPNSKIQKKDRAFVMSPQILEDDQYALYILDKENGIAPGVQKIERFLKVNKATGLMEETLLTPPRIIKTIEAESSAQPFSDSEDEEEYEQVEYESDSEHSDNDQSETDNDEEWDTLSDTTANALGDINLDMFTHDFNNDSNDSENDASDFSEETAIADEKLSQYLEEYTPSFDDTNFLQDQVDDDFDFSDPSDKENTNPLENSPFFKAPARMTKKNILSDSKKITFFRQLPSDARREWKCSKRIEPQKNIMEIINTDKNCYIIDEFFEGPSLSSLLKDNHVNPQPYSNKDILKWMIQIVSAVDFLHEKNIVHGDIKPDNIILSFDETGTEYREARLIDRAGSAVLPDNDIIKTKTIKDFTLHCVGPEIKAEAEKLGVSVNSVEKMPASKAFDLYQLGLTLLNCLGYAYDKDVGLDERVLNRNRERSNQYNAYTTKLSDEIKSDELRNDLAELKKTFDSFGPAGSLLQDLIEKAFSPLPANRGNSKEMLNELKDIEQIYLNSLNVPRPNIR